MSITGQLIAQCRPMTGETIDGLPWQVRPVLVAPEKQAVEVRLAGQNYHVDVIEARRMREALDAAVAKLTDDIKLDTAREVARMLLAVKPKTEP